MQDQSNDPPAKKVPGRPFVKGDPRAGRPQGRQNETTIEVRAAARKLIEDPVYLKNLKARLQSGELAPPVETMLWHYAYGKPKESIELSSVDKPLAILISGAMPVPHDLQAAVSAAPGPETTTTWAGQGNAPPPKGEG